MLLPRYRTDFPWPRKNVGALGPPSWDGMGVADLKTCPSPHAFTIRRNWSFYVKNVGIKFGCSGAPPLGTRVCMTLTKKPLPHVGYRAEFDRCWSNGTNVRMKMRWKNWVPCTGTFRDHLRSLELTRIDRATINVPEELCLEPFPSCRESLPENFDFPIQSLLTPLDLGNSALARETRMMEVPGREKVWNLQPFGYNTRTDGLRPTANTAPCAITHSVARYIRRITKKNKPTLVINTHNTLNLRLSLTNTSIRTTSVNVHVHKLVTS